MGFPKECYLSEAMCVAMFSPDPLVRHKSAEIEAAFRDLINVQASATNVPDSFPPDIPRIQLQSSKKLVTVSQVNAQLVMSFDRHAQTSVEDTFAIVEKNARSFWGGAQKFKNEQNLKDFGFVVTVCEPAALQQQQLAEILFEKFFTAGKLGEFASTSFQIGFRDGPIFKNFSASSYEIRSGAVDPAGAQRPIFIHADQLAVDEQGFEYKFDVNNKPALQSSDEEHRSFDTVIVGMQEMLFKDSANLLGWAAK